MMKELIKKNKWKIIISTLLTLAPMLIGFILWNKLPDNMLTHWGGDGAADGSMSKLWAIILMPLILAVLNLVCLFVTFIDKKSAEQNEKIIRIVFWIMPVMSFLVNGFMYSVALGNAFNPFNVLPILIGILFIFLGNYLPKASRNRTYGVKLSWTLGNDENWNKTHRFTGRLWVAVGLILLVSAFLPTTAMIAVTASAFAVSIISPFVYSYIIYRKHKSEGVEYEKVFAKTKGEKIAVVISLICVALILVFVAVIMFTGNIVYTLGEDSFEIEASYYDDLTVKYSEIDSIEYSESTKAGYRTFGFGSARLSMGRFENEEFGDYTRYCYTACKESIVIKSGDRVLVINLKTTEETLALYNSLADKCK
jgi:uncharacterized membrane protein